MAKYELTNKAVEDLTNIWEYTIDKWSEQQADHYFNVLISSCQNIADNPDLGKSYEGIAKELLGLKIEKHIIFYRKRENKPIEITRILHERMDLKSRMGE
ncbi:type II toxin-antitoxin system RelE/ParE family toxin [Riemerella anatipestifer]|uniref:type II toxin-antitoxin system RelE/ParE family toxin n=1 Tax=Riemerella anatipestifer TaxID=34085 RepID=UPI00129EBB6A|nr:type II toxin-antitoxin system RelE/ParE family toxin [Riemerella anatipestifer]MBT0550668.1 type II toxin-antitoxin system RelE/ParE family toxin [Riemerella anatipestifer]MBT0554930.1 type II toxin-antitoxin system RelE/ParE family toxin [Riemerella anatipestifer]MCU7542126.1 type II toxin-antitoxin system RelE/ParE family toxin [Riemerella anatipestifer]MCU7559447.1 type II toxin-antitoxin system RelE/ParE family toxin [Riemerella anatipestifer]MCW0512886.1 type II toxin-antitoxin system